MNSVFEGKHYFFWESFFYVVVEEMNENIVFNKEKFKNMLHYIISKCKDNDTVGRTVLFKLLYFSDFDFYELYEKSLSGETYIHKPQGPMPSHFYEAKDELIREGKIKEKSRLVIDYPRIRYFSLKPVDSSIFTEKELAVINNTINRRSHMRSGKISEYSHGDIPWRLTNEGEELNYESVFYRDPEYSVREYDDCL